LIYKQTSIKKHLKSFWLERRKCANKRRALKV